MTPKTALALLRHAVNVTANVQSAQRPFSVTQQRRSLHWSTMSSILSWYYDVNEPLSVCFKFCQLCSCQILFELVYRWENSRLKKGGFFGQYRTECAYLPVFGISDGIRENGIVYRVSAIYSCRKFDEEIVCYLYRCNCQLLLALLWSCCSLHQILSHILTFNNTGLWSCSGVVVEMFRLYFFYNILTRKWFTAVI